MQPILTLDLVWAEMKNKSRSQKECKKEKEDKETGDNHCVLNE